MYYGMNIPYKLRETIKLEDLSAFVSSDGNILVVSNLGYSAYTVQEILARHGIGSKVGWASGVSGQVCFVDEASIKC